METECFSISQKELCTLPPIKTRTGIIKAGMSTRNGGYSSHPYATLNFGYHVEDDLNAVTKNRKLFGKIIGLMPERWVGAEQVHGVEVQNVSKADAGKGALDYSSAIKGTDGLLTADTNLLLTACYADCTPLYFWSEEHSAVGIAHAGWKGTVGEIASIMVEKFKTSYGIDAKDLSVAIGPSIGVCCYEVDDKVADKVKALSGINTEIVLVLKENGHYMLNLQLLNKLILLKSGVLEQNIHLTSLCTSCHTETFYSHRKEGAPTGRMMSYIGIFSGD
jgi:polyphenol oxidase